ncbi:endoglucanase 14-like protein, partial [Tanacetum coccineum]
ELSPSNYPGRHVARDTYPQRHVARESEEMSLGIVTFDISLRIHNQNSGYFSFTYFLRILPVIPVKEVLSGGLLAKNLSFKRYIDSAEEFICNCVGIGNNNLTKTKGGLLWFTSFSSLEYLNSASFVTSAYADYVLKSTTWCIPKYQSREEMAGNNGGKDGQITLYYPMLSRSNYAAWAIKMRVFMQAQGV